MDKIHLRIGSALDNQLVIESVDVAVRKSLVGDLAPVS